MKAILCESFGDPSGLTYGETPQPTPSDDEVLIRVQWCGVNYPDTLIVQGKYQFRPELPFSPGGEVAGTLEAVGKNVTMLKVGQPVLAAMGWGGFAEFAVAKATNTFLVPEGVPLQSAAVLLETYGTAIHALKDRAMMKPGETLVVLGAAGGTGTAAVQLGRFFGTNVIAVASTETKRAHALKQGAALAFSPEEMKEAVKKAGGADVIFDPVGGEQSEAAFRTLKPGGRHLVVGFASGEVPAIPLNLPLLKSASMVGVFWGHFWRNEPEENRKNVRMLLRWLAEEKLQPQITKTYPLAQAGEALQSLMDRKVIGKVVLEVTN